MEIEGSSSLEVDPFLVETMENPPSNWVQNEFLEVRNRYRSENKVPNPRLNVSSVPLSPSPGLELKHGSLDRINKSQRLDIGLRQEISSSSDKWFSLTNICYTFIKI